MKPWTILLAVYFVWNACAYTARLLFKDDIQLYDYSYWMGEKVFVITAFWSLLEFVPVTYRWVLKTFICVAIYKTVYLLLVIGKVIQKNDLASMMGLLFTAIMSIIIFLWEKQSRQSRIH